MKNSDKLKRELRQELHLLADQHPWLVAYVSDFGASSAVGGRPPSAFPRKSYSCKLSQEEMATLKAWQSRFSSLMGKNSSRGETVGLLTRIITLHYQSENPADDQIETFGDLMDILLKEVSEKKKRLRKLAEKYPYHGMYAASLDTPPIHTQVHALNTRRKNVSLRLTSGEASVLEGWQARFQNLLDEKPQRGETIGLISWILTAHYEETLREYGSPPQSFRELLLMLKIT
jgi:hypothetical protein